MEIEAIYGLCNRLQTLVGFYTFCNGGDLKIVWKENNECPGFFEDYFQPLPNLFFLKNKTNQNQGRYYKFDKENFKVDYDFEKLMINNYSLIKPKSFIEDIIIKMKVNEMIGLHIRRTDFLPHIKKFNPKLVKRI